MRQENSHVISSRTVHHLVVVSADADGWINRLRVLGLVAVAPWSGLRDPQISTHSTFTCGGYLKAMVYKEKFQNMDNLKERIQSGITCITPDVLTRVHHEWERRLCVCLQTNGNHVENAL